MVNALIGFCRGITRRFTPFDITMCPLSRRISYPSFRKRGLQQHADARQARHELDHDFFFGDAKELGVLRLDGEPIPNCLADVRERFLARGALRVAAAQSRTTNGEAFFRLDYCDFELHS